MENEVKSGQEFEFKAEMKQLLNLIVHSLYTHPEIFVRELVSNASDALNKLRFKRLTNPDILQPDAELGIKIKLDKENGIFSIEDSGIGMNNEELTANLGTIASSGTLQFLKNMKEQQKSLDGNMIGQFGVGFYSIFMVTDEVTVETRSADAEGKAYKWISKGEEKYIIDESDKETRGTTITFKLKDEYKEYAEDYTVKNVLNKYSNFVDFPIYVNDEKVNNITALWHKKKDDTTTEELNEFYKFISADYQEPLGHLQLNIEGVLNFKALLFIPKVAPPYLFRDLQDKSLHLYSNKVFIQDDCKDLLPDYLKFVKGVVDTEDLPLNVSREVTQSSPIMTKIKNTLTSKLLALFEDWAENDNEKFLEFYKQFSPVFKTGINSDFTNKDKIVNLLRFETSLTEKEKLSSLKDYVSRMKDGQNDIFYVAGDNRENIVKNPNLEYFFNNNIEVIFLTDPVDLFTITYIFNFENKPLKSIDKADIDVSKTDNSANDLSEDITSGIIETFKKVLEDNVQDVIKSKRLVDSPCTLVVGKDGMDPQMEKIMQMMDKGYSGSKRILEINTSHEIIKNLAKLNIANPDDEFLKKTIIQLYEGSMLIEGYLKSPIDYVKRMNEFILKATR
jgi:molecular chaperone HtpG